MNAIQTVTINSTDIAVKEYNGKRVVTFKDIDACHERPEGTARKRFNDNKYRFIEGEDYFTINQPSEIRTLGITRPQGGVPDKVTVVTGSGYLMLVKSFTDELAWQIQRMLEIVDMGLIAANLSFSERKEKLNSFMHKYAE